MPGITATLTLFISRSGRLRKRKSRNDGLGIAVNDLLGEALEFDIGARDVAIGGAIEISQVGLC